MASARAGRRGPIPRSRSKGPARLSRHRQVLPWLRLDLGGEAVSDSALGLDVDRLLGGGLDLAAQPRDVHAQPFLVGFLVAVPGLGQERLVGDYPTRVAHE